MPVDFHFLDTSAVAHCSLSLVEHIVVLMPVTGNETMLPDYALWDDTMSLSLAE
jgi:hypothetical protein